MRGSRPTMAAVALILAATTACGAAYHPRPGPRIVDVGGEFHRDGQSFPIGTLGGGAEALVAGDARALEYARRQQSLLRRGYLVYGLGLVIMVAGSIGAAATLPERARTPVVLGVVGLGAGVSVLGMRWQFQGRAALLDAINVYNDDLDAARAGTLPAASPGGGP